MAMSRLVAILFTSCICVAQARADDVDQRVKELEAKVERLEDQVKWLHAELQKAKERAANDEANVDDSRAFSSAVDILKAMPDELQPHHVKGWDKFVVDKVYDWLKRVPVGERFEARLEIERAVVYKNSAATLNPSAHRWRLEIVPKFKNYKHRGIALRQQIGWPSPLKIYGDDEFGKKADRLKQGQFITVKGRIHSVILSGEQQGRRDFRIGLADYKIESKLLE